MEKDHRKRCQRFGVPGDAHFLTFSCFGRMPLLSKPRTRRWMLDALTLSRQRRQCDLWGYVIMPEHVHLVLLPRPGVSISQILTTVKQSMSKRALLWLCAAAPHFLAQLEVKRPDGKRVHRFWQRGGGYDRNLRSVTDIHEKIDYVHANPVRRGLVKTALEWQWSSARAWHTGLDDPLAIDRDSVPMRMPDDVPRRSG